MSNTTVPFGRPACPFHDSDSGTQQRRVSCSAIRPTHSFQPAIARLSGNVDGALRLIVLSNIRPSLLHPVYCTVTTSFAVGFSVLSPGLMTFEIRPDPLFTASAGGIVRSGGGAKASAADWGAGGSGVGLFACAAAPAIAATTHAMGRSSARISFRSG